MHRVIHRLFGFPVIYPQKNGIKWTFSTAGKTYPLFYPQPVDKSSVQRPVYAQHYILIFEAFFRGKIPHKVETIRKSRANFVKPCKFCKIFGLTFSTGGGRDEFKPFS
jgi:hypothetical protein